MENSGDSFSPNNSIPSFPQNTPTSESDQIQDQTMSVVDATTQEGGSHGDEGKKEGSENVGTEPPSKVLDSCKTVAVSPKKDEREEPGVGGACEKRKSTRISSLCIDFRGALPPPRSAHSLPQEEGGKANKKVKVGEGSSTEAAGLDAFGLNQETKDVQDNEEKQKMKVQEAVVEEEKNEIMACAEKEIEMEAGHSEEKNEGNPSAEEENKEVKASAAGAVVESAQKNEAAATEKAELEAEPAEVPQNDASVRIVRDIDLNQLAPEYEEDNQA